MRTWIKILIPLKLKGILLHWSQDFIWNWNWLETDCKTNLNWASSSKTTSRLIVRSTFLSYLKRFHFYSLIWINYRNKEIVTLEKGIKRWCFWNVSGEKQVGMVSVLCLLAHPCACRVQLDPSWPTVTVFSQHLSLSRAEPHHSWMAL